MVNSILESIKSLLGVNDTSFDAEITMHINNSFALLKELGVCKSFKVIDEHTLFDDVDTDRDIDMIRMYLFYQCRLNFDPPQNTTHLQAFKEFMQELQWRLCNNGLDNG